MNITLKQIDRAKNTVARVLNSSAITDFEDAVALGEFMPEWEKAVKALDMGIKAINKPYMDLASARSNSLRPDGYNTEAEIEEFNQKKETELEKVCPVALKFPILKESTIKEMFKDANQKTKLIPLDLEILSSLGMRKKEKK